MKKILIISGVLVVFLIGLGLFIPSVFSCNPLPPECYYSEIHTIGYWKNHEEVYIPHLPVSLGGEEIATQEQVEEIFKNASADIMKDMLKAQLLAMKFNVIHFGVGGFVYEGKSINQIVSEADVLLQDSSATRQELEQMKNLLNHLNNLGQVLICPNVLGCTDPDALNYNPNATVDDGSCQYPEPDTFSISGMKFNDQNNNGANNSEPGLIGWTIQLFVSDQLSRSTTTDSEGNYSFLNLEPRTYTVCELNQTGWARTYPTVNNGCHIVSLVNANISGIDFGNHHLNFQIPGCTDPEALNYNSEATLDDGTCIYEIPGCTDSNALNYNPSATVNDGSCRYGGGPVRPRFSITKTVAEEFVNAGATANYTIVVECLGSGVARNTVLKDSLPQGFSYKDNEDGEWNLGDMTRGDKKTFTYSVVVSEQTKSGTYTNTAYVQASNSDKFTDSADLEVRVPGVKGKEFFPVLEIEKSVNKSSASAGSYVLYTVKVKNTGEAPAVSVVVKDNLPQGFITEAGKSEIQWNIPLLKIGESWQQSFSAYIQSNVLDGRYGNEALAYAENHPKQVKDTALVTLGSLPHTGINISDLVKQWVNLWDSLINLVLSSNKTAAPAKTLTSYNYLVIPKIGVEIPIVLGSDDSALEKGAWLLPQTTTPDLLSNTALAAHRYKYRPPSKQTFYLLDKVSQGDNLLVYWQGKKYVYSVTSVSIVDPTNTQVLADTEVPTLTLITCHPLFSDISRLVVQGQLIM